MSNNKTISTAGESARKLKILAKENAVLKRSLIERTDNLERTRLATLNLLEDLNSEKDSIFRARIQEEAMLSSIGDGLVGTDKEGRIILVNKAFERILGWKGEEIKGKLLTEAIPMLNERGEVVAEHERPINIILKNHSRAISASWKYQRKDGTVFPVSITTSPVIAGREFMGVVEVFRDITAEKAIDRTKTEFVSLASHQLRSPLTAISWYTEMLLTGNMGNLDEKQRKYLNEVSVGNRRMVDLVDALLDVSRLELGTLAMEPEPTDIVSLVQSEIDGQKPFIDAKRIHLSYSSEKNIPAIQADPKLLRMVIENLLSNAVKYTPEKGKIEIALTLVTTDDRTPEILIKVSDTGYGIPKNQQDKIFTKLFRADNVRQKDTQGTGLGLYIAKSIVENSGGTIRFESEEKKGTTFFVTLPRDGMHKK